MIARRFRGPLLVATLLLALVDRSASEAAPTVESLTASPATVELNVRTTVKVTTRITDASFIAGSAFLQRVSATGSVTTLGTMRDDGGGGDAVAGDKFLTLVVSFTETQTTPIRLRVSAAFKGLLRRVMSDDLVISVGVALPAAFGVTVTGSGQTTLTVEPDSTDVPMVVGIAAAPTATIVAPAVNVSVRAAVAITFETAEVEGGFVDPGQTLQISVPAPPGTPPGADFVVAQQALVDSTDGVSGLRPQLIAVAMAAEAGGSIVSQPSPLPGIVQGGTYAIVTATGSGFATGIISDAAGPAAGVVVSNSTNSLVAITDSTGRFTLFISGDVAFTLTALHPLRGSRGTAGGTLPGHMLTANVNIALTPPATPVVTRDGIRNGGFERCADAASDSVGNLTGSWAFEGSARAVQQFTALSGVVIQPTEGKCMAQITTGPGVTAAGSSLVQRFIVPAGARTLSFDFNFVSEEFEEYVGSVFNDSFSAVVSTPEGDLTIVQVQVNDFMNNPNGFTMIGDCVAGTTDGDATCGQTGWRTASIDLARFGLVDKPVTVNLVFSVVDRGDSLFDTLVFIDNIRFGTVWLDVKVMSGASAPQTRIDQEVRQATEILSQAGLNVRVRRVIPIGDPGGTDPGGLTNVNTDFVEGTNACVNPLRLDGRRTAEEIQAMTLARSTIATDVNVYYVKTGTRTFNGVPNTPVQYAGYAITPDEFCNEVDILTNAGLFLMDFGIGYLGVLAHEVGHMALSAENARSTLEHNVNSDPNNPQPLNIMIGQPMPPTNGIVNRVQSANINRTGAPFVLP